MTRLALVAPLAFVLLHAAPALAQAPGDCACAAPEAVVVVVEHPRKIGVSLRLSALGLHPAAMPEEHSDYSGAGLAVSYRLTPRWGLELAAESFGEQVEGEPTGRELSALSLSATFHLRPRARWDGYLIAGVDAVGDETTSMGGAHVGAGLERRFHRFGLSAELRMLGLSPPKSEAAEPTFEKMDTAATADEGTSGGQVSLAATYYF